MKIEDRLSSGVRNLKGKSRREELLERGLMIGGAVLLVGGFAAIVIGWFGAAHRPLLVEQMPYVVSGGLLGVALVFAGGSFYFAYWLTRMVRETRETHEQANKTFRTMNEMVELLASVLRVEEEAPASQNGQFVATKGGTMFHRAGCAVVAGRSDLRKVSSGDPGMEPCKMCDPLGAPTS